MGEMGSTNIERAFTIGGVEKSVEQRINAVAQKVKESGILDSSRFETDEDRKLTADSIIKSINPSFSSYEQIVNISRGGNYFEAQKKNAQETFDILKKSVSLAMNDGGNQELQTRLFTGGVEDVLPKSWLYGKDNSSLNLVDGVREVTITSSVIRGSLKDLEESKAYKRIDMESKKDRELKAKLVEDTTLKMIELDLPEEEEDQLRTVRSYLNTQAAILRGESKTDDGSVDKVDQVAVLGKKVTEAMEKMTEAAGVLSGSVAQQKNTERVNNSRSRNREDEVEGSIDTPEKAFDLVSRLLDGIERTTLTTDSLNSDMTRHIGSLGVVIEALEKKNDLVGFSPDKLNYSEIRLMAESRLALHDSALYMAKSDFKLGDKGLEAAEGAIEGANRVLNYSRLKFLLREGKKMGIPVDMAFDEIERSGFDYKGLLKEMENSPLLTKEEKDRLKSSDLKLVDSDLGHGTTIEGLMKNYWFDNDVVRKGIVDKYLIQKITNATGMDGGKAYQLAQKLITASGECSVFNFGLDRNDELCRCIHFGYFRKYYAVKGRLEHAGPMSTVDNIPYLTGGWLRHMSHKEGGTLSAITAKDIVVENNDEADETMSFTSYYNKYIKHLDKVRKALLSLEADPKVMKNNDFLGLVVQSIDKIDPPNDLINIPGVGYRKINVSYVYDHSTGKEDPVRSIDGITEPIVKVGTKYKILYKGQELVSEKSRGGKLDLRANYGLGLLESIAVRGYEQWNGYSIMDLKRAFTKTQLSGLKPFLNEAMWEWINKQPVAHIEKNGGDFKNLTFTELFRSNQKRIDRKSFLEALAKVVQSGKV